MGNNFLADVPGEHTFRARILTVALGTDKKQALLVVPFDCKVVDVKMINEAAITGHATNNFTASVMNGGSDGSGTTVVASKAYTAGNDAAALDPDAMTNSATPANLNLSQDDVLVYDKTEAGSGLADPDKVVEITVQAR